jgi:hypothetical protein
MTEQEEELVNKTISRTQRETELTMLSKYQGAFYRLLVSFKEYVNTSNNDEFLVFDKIEHELHLLQLKIDKDYIEKWEKEILEDHSTFPLGLISREQEK